MRVFRGIALGAVWLLAACEINRTPAEYFDHQDRTRRELTEVAEELRDRVLALGPSLERGSASEAMRALNPSPTFYLLGPDEAMVMTGAEQVDAALASLAGEPIAAEVRDVEVGVGPGGNAAWFRARLHLQGGRAVGAPLRMTGVFIRREGAWELVQAHLSLPFTARDSLRQDSLPASPPAPAADSAVDE